MWAVGVFGLGFRGLRAVAENSGFPTARSTVLGGPNLKGYSILGSILGYPNFGKLPIWG